MEVWNIRLDDFADGLAYHHLANLNRRSVRWASAHSAAHVRIKREINRPQQHPARTGLGSFGLSQAEICLRGLAGGARSKENLAVLCRVGIHWLLFGQSLDKNNSARFWCKLERFGSQRYRLE